MNVALFGGSFNPPHLAHQLAIACVLSTARVDELWLVPTFKHPFDKALVPFTHRVRMCELAAALFTRVRVCPVEEELGGESFTLRTVKTLHERHPEHRFSLVIGADLVRERARWHGWVELERLVPFIVVGRQGAVATAEVALPPISSTGVRERLQRGESVDALVPATVIDYIVAHGLFR